MIQGKEHEYAARIPEHARAGLELLTEKGYEAYLVGGAVRDLLLGGDPSDFDLATNATPLQILEVFKSNRTILTGFEHGTITVIMDSEPVEITSYRVDGTYSDARRPDQVTFSHSLEEDVKRRDFTINALAMDASGHVIDFVGGVQDLRKKTIRCVGDPNLRMQEDALRILRALRFSAVLGFPIEKETRHCLFQHKKLLTKVSVERIWSECTALLCGEQADQVLLHYISIIGVVMPELRPMKGFAQYNPHHVYDVLEHTALVVKNTPPQKSLRLAALFHDCGKPAAFSMDTEGVGHFYGHQKISRDIAHEVMMRMKADTKTREQVETLVLWHDADIEPEEKFIRRRLNQFGEATLRDLLTIKRADTMAQSEKSLYRLEELEKIRIILDKVIEDSTCFSLKDLAIRGEDVIAAGVRPGPRVGKILKEVLHQVIEGIVPNEPEPLRNLAAILHKEHNYEE